MLRSVLLLAVLWVGLTTSWSAPVSFKELDLMVRMRVSEGEIMRDVQSRRLLTPLTAAEAEELLKKGASARLVQQLQSGDLTVSREDAARIAQQQMESKAAAARARAQDEAAVAARRQGGSIYAPVPATMRNMFDGKLVRMENGSLRSYSANELRNVRYYALYYSAHWCGPCRKFTPQLVNFYKEFKARYPEFEVIFISSDYSEQDMAQYMKSAGMPWPAVKHGLADSKLRSLAGSGIPWLGIYNAAGEPVSSNGKDKQWISPDQVLNAFQDAVKRAQSEG